MTAVASDLRVAGAGTGRDAGTGHDAGTDLVRTVEQAEAEAMYAFVTGAPPDVKAALGVDAARIGGGVALAMRHDVTGFWNQVLGLGCAEPVTAEVLAEVAAFYRDTEVAGTSLLTAPDLLPADWPRLVAGYGLVPGPVSVRLAGDVDEAVDRTAALLATRDGPDAGLRVEPVAAQDAAEYGAVTTTAFGMPAEHYGAMIAASSTLPGFHPYLARHDGRAVGAGTVRTRGRVAQLLAGGVLPAYRRRGGQTALLHARALAARERGCRLLTGATGAERPGAYGSSLHNLVRAGLRVRYERTRWRWRADARVP